MSKSKNARVITVPLDGSENSYKALNYLSVMYDGNSDVQIMLFYVLPTLPPMFDDDPKLKKKVHESLATLREKNIGMAEEIFKKGRKILEEKGFDKNNIKSLHCDKKVGIARDICMHASCEKTDAVVIASQGKSRLRAFFMGEVANNVVEYSKDVPVWLVYGKVEGNKVLIAIDNSDRSMRAVEHAGEMLAGTTAKITLFYSKQDILGYLPKDLLDIDPEIDLLYRKKVEMTIDPFMKKAKAILEAKGIGHANIAEKIVDGSRSVAADILNEIQKGSFGTLVIGRKGTSNKKDYNMGSNTRKLLHECRNIALCIVN